MTNSVGPKDIKRLQAGGIFSEIDIHFAKLMTGLSEKENPEVFLAAALVSRATGEGNICLDLSTIEGKPLKADGLTMDVFICPKLEQWRKELISSNVVGRPGDYTPLVLDGQSRLYLYRYWQYEKALADNIEARVSKEIEGVNFPLLKDGLSRLFSPTQGDIDWQKISAFLSVTKKFCVISGGPGTGKTTVIAKILSLILEQNKNSEARIALATPTGKAAMRLQEAIKKTKEKLPVSDFIKEGIVGEASTIHRLLGALPGSPYFRYNAENPLPVDAVVVDEASMVDLALMSKLVQAVPRDARIILLGDKDQLASIEAGAVLGDICDSGRVHGFSQYFSDMTKKVVSNQIDSIVRGDTGSRIQDCMVQLRKNYRFGIHSGIAGLSKAVNKGDSGLALGILKGSEYDDISWRPLPASNILGSVLRDSVIQAYKPYLSATDPLKKLYLFNKFRILCALRKGPYGVFTLNLLVEQILSEKNLIDKGKRWYRDSPVMITKNDYSLGLFNGDIGIIMSDSDSDNELRVFFLSSNGNLRKFSPSRLPEHETVYAMTVHKSQGSEFDKVLLILPENQAPVLTRELIYTGITRAKKSVEVWGREGVFLESVNRRIERTSGLRDILWGN